jgi:hypothetical protein
MYDLSIKNVIFYLSLVSSNEISLTYHARERIKEKLEEKLVQSCLLNREIVGILKQSPLKFKLFYKHPEDELEYDLIIVIVFKNYPKWDIRIVTIYEQKNKRRVREDD